MSAVTLNQREGATCIFCLEDFAPGERQYTHVGGEGHDGLHQECMIRILSGDPRCPYDRTQINPDINCFTTRTERIMRRLKTGLEITAHATAIGVAGVLGAAAALGDVYLLGASAYLIANKTGAAGITAIRATVTAAAGVIIGTAPPIARIEGVAVGAACAGAAAAVGAGVRLAEMPNAGKDIEAEFELVALMAILVAVPVAGAARAIAKITAAGGRGAALAEFATVAVAAATVVTAAGDKKIIDMVGQVALAVLISKSALAFLSLIRQA